MPNEISIPLGVVVAREKIDHPWQEYRWRTVSVFLNAPEQADWRELMRDARCTHYHAATIPLVLHRKDTMSYQVNFANGDPAIYVILREEPDGERPISVHAVTASPFEAQAHGNLAFDTVDRVAMPDTLAEIINAFVDKHHVEEKFVKRQRLQHKPKDEEHRFGQEPIVILRERMAARHATDDGDATKPRDKD